MLTVRTRQLSKTQLQGFIPDIDTVLEIFTSTDAEYVNRREAEIDYSRKQLVSYILVHNRNRLLAYRRGHFNRASQTIQGKRSIGFGGHVTQDDLDLMAHDPIGLYRNASRELYEELSADDLNYDDPAFLQRLRLLGFLNNDETDEGRRHIAGILVYHCNDRFSPTKGELSINELCWLRLDHRINDFGDFESWSQTILDLLYSGALRLGTKIHCK